MHTQIRYATCSKGMLEKKIKKERCIPKEDMPHAHKACQKKKKDSPHPWKIKKRDGSCKGVHPSSTKKKQIFPHTCTSWSDCTTHFCLDLVIDLTI